MDITNKTAKPLTLRLPGGKSLFLGPGKTAQVTAKTLEHPPVAALIESGEIVASSGDARSKAGGNLGPRPAMRPGSRHGGPGARRQSGDR
jgi:hypothetical protein